MASGGSRTCTGLVGGERETEVASLAPLPGPRARHAPSPLFIHKELRTPDQPGTCLGVASLPLTRPHPSNSGTFLLAIISHPRPCCARKGYFLSVHWTMSLHCPDIKPPSDLGATDWCIVRPPPQPSCGLLSLHPCLTHTPSNATTLLRCLLLHLKGLAQAAVFSWDGIFSA